MPRAASSAPPPLVLASGSPRRRRLLEAAGLRFTIAPSDVPEVRADGEAPEAFALRLARDKASFRARARRDAGEPAVVLGADTIVVLGDDVLGKPRDADDAVSMLSRLVGRTHVVTTAVAVATSEDLAVRTTAVHSHVTMRAATPEELREYVALGESFDKAGAYALQGEGRRFVERVAGSETNVIGLPVEETLALIEAVAPGCVAATAREDGASA